MFAVKAVEEAVDSVVCPVTPRVPTTPRVNPGVEEAMPTLPLVRIWKSVVPDEDATAKGLTVDVPCTKSVSAGIMSVPILTLPRLLAKKMFPAVVPCPPFITIFPPL